jgi:hypothetical protein
MHDLRQRRCPIITPALLCLKFANVCESSLVALSIGVQSYPQKIKSITKSDCWIVI